MPYAIFLPNPFDLTDREVFELPAGKPFAQWWAESGFADRSTEQPIVVFKNGAENMEVDYGERVKDGDIFALASLPEGEALVAIGIFIATYWVEITFVVLMVASLVLVGTMEPGLPETADSDEGSPTYSVSARGNHARIGKPKPVIYGVLRVWPDYSAKPYTEFDANGDQYLYQLFEVTQGEADIQVSSMRFEDTLLSSFGDYQVEVIPPGGASTLFPAGVIVSSEVQNFELTMAYVGPYTVNASATTITQIAVDVVAAAGIFSQDRTSGALHRYAVDYKFEAREIDDSDLPIGSWFDLAPETMEGYDRDAIRRTHKYAVPEGRYEARAVLLTLPSSSIYISDTIQWVLLKGYLSDASDTTTTTRVAVTIRASEQLGNKAVNKFNLIAARKLLKWSSSTGWTASPVLTSNPVWAFCDACRAFYGGSRADSHIDLVGLEPIATQLDTDNIEFNGTFDTKGTLWGALQRIAQAAFAMPVDNAGVYTMVRDTLQTTPTAMFTMRNIVKDSFKIDHIGVLEETADSVRVEYLDAAQDYRPAEITCTLSGGTANNLRRVKLFGTTDKDRAYERGLYLAAVNQYRRQLIEWETGIEGRIPFYGDLVTISHYMLGVEGADQVSGEVTAFDGVDLLTVTEAVSGFTSPYIVLRNKEGAPMGPYQAAAVGTNQVRVLDAFDSSQLSFAAGYERTHFAVGEGSTFTASVKVTKVSPVGQNRVKISGFVDNVAVYTAASGMQTPTPSVAPGLNPVVPTVTNLVATVRGTTTYPEVQLTWTGANSDKYIIEVSTDGGVSWKPAGVGFSLVPYFTHQPAPGVLQYRVAGQNLMRGAWASITGVDTSAAAYSPPNTPTALALRSAFTGATLEVDWTSETQNHRVEVWYGGVMRRTETVAGVQWDFTAASALLYGVGRVVDVRVYAIGENGVLSPTYASLSVSNPAPAALSNLAVTIIGETALITFDWPTDPDLDGITVHMGATPGFAINAASIAIDRSADPVLKLGIQRNVTRYIRVGAVDLWATDTTDANYSAEYTITGSQITETEISDDSISTPKLKANSVTAGKIFVTTLDAITANMGTLTSGLLRTAALGSYRVELEAGHQFPLWLGTGTTKNAANGRIYFDANTGQFVIKDGSRVVFSTGSGLDVQWGEVAGAGKPSDNATVGATWGTDLGGQPSDAALLNAQQLWIDVAGAGRPSDNADVTGANTSADTTLVGGVSASVVRAGAGGACRNGFENGEFTDWSPVGGTITQDTSDPYSGTYAALFEYQGVVDPLSSGSTGTGVLLIPSELALQFAGKRVRVSVYAKQPATNASAEFGVAYSTGDVGNSGWQLFTPTTSWAAFSFFYDVPLPIIGGLDYLGIWSDTSNASKDVLIDCVSIEIVSAEGDLDALGLVNGPAAAGATPGATWGVDVGGQPSDAAFLNAQQQWVDVAGASRPADNADVTVDQMGGNGINVVLPQYSSFEATSLPGVVDGANATSALETGLGFIGSQCLKVAASGADAWVHLAPSSGDFNTVIAPNQKWLFSFWVRASAASVAIQGYLRASDTTYYVVNATTSATANTWTRVSGVLDLSANASTKAVLRVDNDGGAGVNAWFDGLMLEPVIGNLMTPSAYVRPYNWLLDAGAMALIDQITPGNISTYIAAAAIDTAYITDLAVTTAKIVDANITTLKVAGRAVTNPTIAYTEAMMSITPGSWLTVQTVSITTAGELVGISGLSYTTEGGDMRITRDGIVIYEIDGIASFSATILIPAITQDTPSAAAHTYRLEIRRNVGTGSSSHRTLTVTEMKR